MFYGLRKIKAGLINYNGNIIMCGILGYFDFNKDLPSEYEFRKALNLMKHRGPDGFGINSFDHGVLGHRRLSIIDLSKNAKQPMTNENQTIWITFNGEIFNYKELRDELKNHEFKSNSDTEVLIHGYEEWGLENLLSKLNGQFAFGIWDENKKSLYLARDRTGINPLYYHYNNNKLIFASELKSINYFINCKQIDNYALFFYFKFGYILNPATVYTAIKKLRPATYIKITNNKFIEKTYWTVDYGKYIYNEPKLISKINFQLEKSIKDRLISDVPVGAFLSGGVDSSAVVSIITKYKENTHTFSIGFEEDKYDETEYAQKISNYLNTNHHTKILSDSDFHNCLDNIPYYYDEPFADVSQIPTMMVSELAKKYVTVSLSGDGGDELFGGYTRYKSLQKLKRWFSILRIFKNQCKQFSENKLNFYLPLKLNEIMNTLYYYYYVADNNNDIKIDDNILNLAQKIDLKAYLTDDILVKVDRASLAYSLESRPPLLDHNLIELAYRIPPEYRINNGIQKYIFKKALINKIPAEILNRQKMGFGMDCVNYIKDFEFKYNYFDKKVPRLFFDKIIKKPNNSQFWNLLIYQKWAEFYEY